MKTNATVVAEHRKRHPDRAAYQVARTAARSAAALSVAKRYPREFDKEFRAEMSRRGLPWVREYLPRGGAAPSHEFHKGRLSDAEVRTIREQYRRGTRQVVIAAAFGISQSHVSNICCRRNRKDVA